jgi:hypothetical protein
MLPLLCRLREWIWRNRCFSSPLSAPAHRRGPGPWHGIGAGTVGAGGGGNIEHGDSAQLFLGYTCRLRGRVAGHA